MILLSPNEKWMSLLGDVVGFALSSYEQLKAFELVNVTENCNFDYQELNVTIEK